MPRKASNCVSEHKKTTIVKKLPSTETGAGVLCKTRSGKLYEISQYPEKQRHTLWRVVDGGYGKIVSAESPHDLYSMIDWDK